MVPSIKEKAALEPTDISATASVVEINEAVGFDHSATKKLLRKLDWHIIPFMSLIYLLVLQNTVLCCCSNWIPNSQR